MTPAAKKVLDEAMALSVEERRKVTWALLDALPPETADEIEAAWNQEARRRAEQLERGDVQSLDGQEALRALEARIRGIHGT